MLKRFNYISFIILVCLAFFNLFEYCQADVFEYPTKINTIQLPELSNIKCKFRQEKTIMGISKPLVSSGSFEFIKNKGVYFYTTYPIKSTVDYTNKNYKQINDIMKAISSKKYNILEKDFNFYYTKQNSNWTLGLKPKQKSSVKNYVASILITGNDYIHQITIKQTNGNKTIIWFSK